MSKTKTRSLGVLQQEESVSSSSSTKPLSEEIQSLMSETLRTLKARRKKFSDVFDSLKLNCEDVGFQEKADANRRLEEHIQNLMISDEKALEELREHKAATTKASAQRKTISEQLEAALRKKELKAKKLSTLKLLAEKQKLLIAKNEEEKENARSATLPLSFYEQQLGLEIRQLNDDPELWTFLFHAVSTSDRACELTLRIGSSYQLVSSVPAVADLEDLVERLNKTGDLQSFLVTVRNRFKDSCA